MQHGLSFIPPGVQALAADEHDAAIKAIKAAEALGTKMEGHEQTLNGLGLDLGQLLDGIMSRGWITAVKGEPFESWCRKNLKNAAGEPLRVDAAKYMARVWKKIHEYPLVEEAVRKGDPVRGFFCTRTGAYKACTFAELAQWRKEEILAHIHRGPITSDIGAEAITAATRTVQERIIELLHKKTGAQIQDDLDALKAELKLGNQSPRKFVRLSSPVVEQAVHEKTMAVLARLVELSGEKANVMAMHPTSIFARLSGFAEDVLNALDQAKAGDSAPLKALLQAVKEK